MGKKLLPKVKSLWDLQTKAGASDQYLALAVASARNLGGSCETLGEAMKWLTTNAQETSEAGVMTKVNSCRGLVR